MYIAKYYISVKKCKPGELYLIGNSDKKSIYTFKEAQKKLINMSNLKNVKIIEDKKYVRPTNVPRLIGDMRKFQKATSWKPKIGFNQILLDTLNYWRSKV